MCTYTAGVRAGHVLEFCREGLDTFFASDCIDLSLSLSNAAAADDDAAFATTTCSCCCGSSSCSGCAPGAKAAAATAGAAAAAAVDKDLLTRLACAVRMRQLGPFCGVINLSRHPITDGDIAELLQAAKANESVTGAVGLLLYRGQQQQNSSKTAAKQQQSSS